MRRILVAAEALLISFVADPTFADQFEVTIVNLTRGQQFTPLLVKTHKGNVRIFTLGAPASGELRTLAALLEWKRD